MLLSPQPRFRHAEQTLIGCDFNGSRSRWRHGCNGIGEWLNQHIFVQRKGTANSPSGTAASRENHTDREFQIGFWRRVIVVEGFVVPPIPLTRFGIAFRTSENLTAQTLFCAHGVTARACSKRHRPKWISLYGTHNTVEHCSIVDKFNQGCAMVVWFEKDVVPAHTIAYNYFSRPRSILGDDGNGRNGQECLRIGTSDYSMQRSECIVRNNCFYRCNGEVEIISNKSCFNTYEGNLFEECNGTLTLRHGDDCTVCGNLFFGNGVANTGGIRLMATATRSKQNYLQELTGKGYYLHSLIRASPTPNQRLCCAKRVHVVNNTIVTASRGSRSTTRQTQRLPIENNTIASIVVVNYSDNTSVEILRFPTPVAPWAQPTATTSCGTSKSRLSIIRLPTSPTPTPLSDA